MKRSGGNSLQDRLQAQAEAKEKMLERFKQAPKADDPAMIARREERAKIAAAREERRKAAVEQKRLEQELEELRIREEEEAKAKALREEADRLVAIEAEKKAERDRRYAARKARRR